MKNKSGPARMMELGKKPSLLWYDPEDYAMVKMAAKLSNTSMTRLALAATLNKAREVISADSKRIED